MIESLDHCIIRTLPLILLIFIVLTGWSGCYFCERNFIWDSTKEFGGKFLCLLNSAPFFGWRILYHVQVYLKWFYYVINVLLLFEWQRTWGKPVLDRVGLIIEIFNAHAYTKEAKLQVLWKPPLRNTDSLFSNFTLLESCRDDPFFCPLIF